MRVLEHELGTIYVPDQHDSLDGLYELSMNASLRDQTWAADTETTGLDIYSPEYRVRLVQVGTRDEAWLLRPDFPEHAEAIEWAVTRPGTWWHNFVFDALSLESSEGIDADATMVEARDTEILSRLLDPRGPEHGGVGHHLKGLSQHYLGLDVKDARAVLLKSTKAKKYRDDKGKLLTSATLWRHVPVDDEDYLLYAGQDVFLTARLADRLLPLVEARGLTKFETFELGLAIKCAQMQRIGTAFDKEYALEQAERLTEEHAAAECELKARWGITPTASGSAATAKKSLTAKFIELGWKFTEFTEKTQEPKLTSAVMDDMVAAGGQVGELAQLVLTSKKAKHYADYLYTMVDLSGKDGRIHPDIRPMRAATARMSISNPPLQQLPKDDVAIRGALIADEGDVLLSADYAQVEFRVAAAVSRDPVMIERILKGEDLHASVATILYGPDFTPEQRDIAKRVGFGRLYRGLPKGLAGQTNLPLPIVKKACRAFDIAYPATARWGDKVQAKVKAGDTIVITATGRQLICEKPWAAVNYSVQSPARDIFAQGIINLHRLGLGDRLRLVVHDEVILSVPEAEAEEYARRVEEAMSMDFRGIPIVTEAKILGKRWHK